MAECRRQVELKEMVLAVFWKLGDLRISEEKITDNKELESITLTTTPYMLFEKQILYS